jgi:predicted aspartyl protease
MAKRSASEVITQTSIEQKLSVGFMTATALVVFLSVIAAAIYTATINTKKTTLKVRLVPSQSPATQESSGQDRVLMTPR